MKSDNKKRLFEVMSRLDKTFKFNSTKIIKENEEIGEGASYKAKLEEIVNLAKRAYENIPDSDIPMWIQDKITAVKVHLTDIVDFYHTKEEKEETNVEGEFRKMDDDEEHEDYISTKI